MVSHKTCIDHISGIPTVGTFNDLRIHFTTGRAIYLSGTRQDKKYTYRFGVQTALGDIEISVWKAAVKRLNHACGEDELQQALMAYMEDHISWWHTKAERL